MIPFWDCTSGGLQLKVIDSAVVASTVKLTGGMLGAAIRDCESKLNKILTSCTDPLRGVAIIM